MWLVADFVSAFSLVPVLPCAQHIHKSLINKSKGGKIPVGPGGKPQGTPSKKG